MHKPLPNPLPALLLPALLCLAGLVAAQEPVEFSAYYQASTNGMSGSAERHLIRQDDGHYRLNVSLEAKVLGITIGNLEQASEFSLKDDRIVPHHYSYRVTGVSRRHEAVSFDWDDGVAVSEEGDQSWRIELGEHTLDQLSYQLALARALARQEGSEFEFQLVDGPDLDTHVYRVVGDEVITTPMGRLNTVKLERVREGDSERVTNIWLAGDWHNLLARIEQINSSGLRIELELESALVNGEQVTPLP